MNTGKIPENILKRSVFKQLKARREEILEGPGVGVDCSIGQFEEDELFALSSDPITGAVKDIGVLAVHVTANDLAAAGAEPVGLMLTILLPEDFIEEDLKTIMIDANRSCEALNIQIMGGHTEVTAAVNKPVVCVTGIGKIKKSKYLNRAKVEAGQDVIMTKWAGLEGTAIIAKAKEDELKLHYNHGFIDQAISFKEHLSIVKEARIAAEFGASSMHDVTEGGIFGALWEISLSAGKGIEVYLDKIPIRQETIEICEYYELNPYKLISSGVLLILADKGDLLVDRFAAQGIPAANIGHIIDGNKRVVIQEDTIRSLEPAKSDELYKIL